MPKYPVTVTTTSTTSWEIVIEAPSERAIDRWFETGIVPLHPNDGTCITSRSTHSIGTPIKETVHFKINSEGKRL